MKKLTAKKKDRSNNKKIGELLFLGTGPTGGIQKGGKPFGFAQGKSRRLESSALIKTERGSILIDVSRHFSKQAKHIDRLDAIMITHAHQDAIGGIAQLNKWAKEQKNTSKIPLYALRETIKKIKNQFKQTEYLKFITIKSSRSFKLLDLTALPFLVKHSIQKGFPTVGYRFSLPNRFSLVYISDIGSWSKKTAAIMKSANILVIDGAMWKKKMIAHLDIKEVLPKFCLWPVKKIIFTQIGKTAPPHDILKQEIKKICSKALPAYDGLVIKLTIDN